MAWRQSCALATACGLLALCSTRGPAAQTVSFRQGINDYAGTRDTHVRDDQPSVNLAATTSIRVDGELPVSHGLLRFDGIFGTAASQIPADAEILSATLTLRSIDPGDMVELHRMLIDWSDTNTWASFSEGLSADDVEMRSEVDAVLTPTAPIPRVDAIDVTPSVQAWSDGMPNHGWGIVPTGPNGWLFQSSESTVISNRPLLTVTYEQRSCTAQLLTGPTSTVAFECSSVTFAAQAIGCRLQYQWFKDGALIEGATNFSYTIARVRVSDQGTYRVVVYNEFGSVTSQGATLIVSLDVVPPRVLCAYSTNDPLSVVVQFSTTVTNATEPFNYEIAPASGGNPLLIASATYSGNAPDRVVLTLNPNTPMQLDVSYRLRGENIYDDCGNAIDPNVTTPVVRFASPVIQISALQLWRFNDQGIDLGSNWMLPNYDDSAWPSGAAVFEAHRTPRIIVNGQPVRTYTSLTNANGVEVPTHYFRTHFQFSGDPTGAALWLRAFVDDGAIFYLNGAEILRLGMPPRPTGYSTLANRTVTTAAFEGPFVFCVPQFLQGDNVFAAEVHQASLASPDLTFAAEVNFLLPSAPTRLEFALSPDRTKATLTWNHGGRLETSNNLADPNSWQEIQNAVSPYGPFPISGTRFFRVRER
jgi:hypothetical protein